MRDIARAVGVSQAAVSLALRNSPLIPEARRQEIRIAARKLGYTPNAAATSLAHFKHNSHSVPAHAALAWINPWPNPKKLRRYKEFDSYWRGASTRAEEFGFYLEEFLLNGEMLPTRLEKVLLARNIQGVLIPPLGSLEIDWRGFNWDQFSVIRFGRTNGAPLCHFVTSAQIANTILAFDKIRERGYRRIGFVGRFHRHITFGAAFLWIQRETDESSWVNPLLCDPDDQRQFSSNLATWLKREKPDAILTSLKELPEVLEKIGCRVPDDVALAGTSVLDIPISAGIDQRPAEIGGVAILTLISLIHDHENGIPPARREILIQGEWVDGPSLPSRQAKSFRND